MSDKKYDIVVLGATGFTGQLVCEYLAQKNGEDNGKKFTFAVAGRNEQKLRSIVSGLNKKIDVLIGDVENQQSIDKVVSQARVLLNTAGPFGKYATPVVDACVRFNTHYTDITGEIDWVKQIIRKYDAAAEKNGTIIVPMCGFDSIPSDIGSFVVSDYIQKRYQKDTNQVRGLVTKRNQGGMSGGTFHTAMSAFENKDGLKAAADPFYLNTNSVIPAGPKSRHFDVRGPNYLSDLKIWSAPFPLSIGNARVVRRSASILKYGPNFAYSEHLEAGSLVKAFLITFGLALFFGLCLIAPIRNIIKRLGPAPGTGPDKKARESGFTEVTFVGTPEGLDAKVKATFSAKGDPGYKVTSLLVAESALCLALDTNQLPYVKKASGKSGGILTAASAMGTSLVERLKRAGVNISVASE